MSFELFDPACDFSVSAGNLPHWFQPGVTYFITFRTDDSIPTGVFDLWFRRRNDWLRRHGIEPKRPDWSTVLRSLPLNRQREFAELFSLEFLRYLQQGHGACLLRHKENALVVAQSLMHFDGDRYRLGDFVIMPNHVHVLVCLKGETKLESQCMSWKRFTATSLNKRLGRQGRFWQEESFDHLVRTPEQFDGLRRYIAENAARVGVCGRLPFHYCCEG